MRLILAIVFGFVVAFALQKTYARVWLSIIVPLFAFLLFVLFDVFLVMDQSGDAAVWIAASIFGVPLILFGAIGGILAARRTGKSAGDGS